MSSTATRLVGLVVVLGVGCAEGAAQQRSVEAPTVGARPYRPGEMPVDSADGVALGHERDSQVKMDFERGYLNQNDVNEVLEKNTPTLIACYDRAGEARSYASGQVKLRFLVSGTGEVTDVLVIENQLGNFPVERCLVVEGRKIPFPKPGGGKPADFEYSLEFRAGRQPHVIDWQGDVMRKQVASHRPALERCGSPGAKPVAAVAYVKPGGQVASIGLASDGPIDTLSAKCMIGQISRWRVHADRGHMVRTTFALSGTDRPVAASSSALGPTARLKRGSHRRVR